MSYTRTQTLRFGPYTGRKNSSLTSFGYVTYSDVKSGVKVPDWRERQKKGEFVASPYSRSTATLSASPGSGTWTTTIQNKPPVFVQSSFNGFASKPGIVGHLGAISGTLRNKALERILARVRSTYEHASLLPDIAELRSTIRQFGAPAEALCSLSDRHLRKVQFYLNGIPAGSALARRARALNIISSTYLEWAFGVQPLINATHDAAEALARWKAEHEDPDIRDILFKEFLHASANETFASSVRGAAVGLPGGSGYMSAIPMTKTVTRCGVRYTVQVDTSPMAEFGSNDRLLSLTGVDARNLPLATWELLPWSWLADYFLNVQQILQAGVTLRGSVRGVVVSERRKTVSDTKLHANYGPPQWPSNLYSYSGDLKDLHFGRWQSAVTDFVRTVPGALGYPTLEASYPASFRKLANMTAALFARGGSSKQFNF